MSIKSFKDVIAWQKAHIMVLFIYEISGKFPVSEEFGLKSQIRRAAVSIPSNIAEGFKRKSNKDSLHFYNIAEGSLEELKYQLILAKDLGYISESNYTEASELTEEVGKLIYGWSKSQKLNS